MLPAGFTYSSNFLSFEILITMKQFAPSGFVETNRARISSYSEWAFDEVAIF